MRIAPNEACLASRTDTQNKAASPTDSRPNWRRCDYSTEIPQTRTFRRTPRPPTPAPGKPRTTTTPNRHSFRAHLAAQPFRHWISPLEPGRRRASQRRRFVHRPRLGARSSPSRRRHWARFSSARTLTQSGSHRCGSMIPALGGPPGRNNQHPQTSSALWTVPGGLVPAPAHAAGRAGGRDTPAPAAVAARNGRFR